MVGKKCCKTRMVMSRRGTHTLMGTGRRRRRWSGERRVGARWSCPASQPREGGSYTQVRLGTGNGARARGRVWGGARRAPSNGRCRRTQRRQEAGPEDALRSDQEAAASEAGGRASGHVAALRRRVVMSRWSIRPCVTSHVMQAESCQYRTLQAERRIESRSCSGFLARGHVCDPYPTTRVK